MPVVRHRPRVDRVDLYRSTASWTIARFRAAIGGLLFPARMAFRVATFQAIKTSPQVTLTSVVAACPALSEHWTWNLAVPLE